MPFEFWKRLGEKENAEKKKWKRLKLFMPSILYDQASYFPSCPFPCLYFSFIFITGFCQEGLVGAFTIYDTAMQAGRTESLYSHCYKS